MAIPAVNQFSQLPGGGIWNVMRSIGEGANALTKGQLENQYYAPLSQANIASKSTYARYLPAQILGQVLSNPLTWQTMPKEQLQNLTQQYSNAISNPPSLEKLANQPTTGHGLLDILFNKLNSPKEQQSIPISQNQINQQHYQIQNPEIGKNITSMNPSYDVASPQGNLPSSTISRVAPNVKLPNAFGGINPITAQQAQAKALETTATGEAKAQTAQWKEIQDSTNNESQGAQNNLNYLDELKNLYPKLKYYEKGPVFGKLPAVTNVSSQIDVASNGLANAVARAQQQGHITQNDRASYSGMKPSRGMNEEAFNNLVNFNEGMNKRILERPAFNNAAQQFNLNPTQAQAVWSYYASEKPFYDSKNNKINNENLGTWEEFLSPQRISEALSPRVQKSISMGKKPEMESMPKTVKEAIKKSADEFKNVTIKMQGIDPIDNKMKVWDVPQGKAQVFLENGFKRVG